MGCKMKGNEKIFKYMKGRDIKWKWKKEYLNYKKGWKKYKKLRKVNVCGWILNKNVCKKWDKKSFSLHVHFQYFVGAIIYIQEGYIILRRDT